jgi:Clostripain family
MEDRMRNTISVLLVSLFSVISLAQASDSPKNWTFLIYLNGNNSLDDFGTTNLNQMEKVGSTDQVNVVVQWASMAAGKTQRLLVKKIDESGKVSSPVIQDMGQVDMGDYNTLVDFVKWGVANYPAQHYFIDVWDHGSGWHQLQSMNHVTQGITKGPIHAQDISLDENTGHWITTEQLGLAMGEAAKIIGHKVDLYGSDACLMAMAEVAGEMTDSVQYFVGSQQTEPGAGWPYTELLTRWNAQANATAADVSKILTEEYVKSYQSGGSNSPDEVTFSGFDLSKMADLDATLSALGAKLRAVDSTERAKLVSAIGSAQSFTNQDYDDLLDYLNLIKQANVRNLVPADFADVETAAKAFIIANADTDTFSRATGLSIWLPADKSTYSTYSDRYNGLKFSAASSWGATLASLFQDSRN